MDDHFLNAIKQHRTLDACLSQLFGNVSSVVLQAKISAGRIARTQLSSHDKVRIAIIVAQAYRCDFSLSRHIAQGRTLGLNGAEMEANRAGFSHDASATELMRFSAALIAVPSTLSDQHFRQLRWAGYGDDDIEEIIMHLLLHAICCLIARRCAPSDPQGQDAARIGP